MSTPNAVSPTGLQGLSQEFALSPYDLSALQETSDEDWLNAGGSGIDARFRVAKARRDVSPHRVKMCAAAQAEAC
jgi:hypothetical protein